MSRTPKTIFANTADVLPKARRGRTSVPVLDFVVGGTEFVTMARPCSVETESQLMATAHHVRRTGARVLRGAAFKPRSSPYAFQGLGFEGLKLLAAAGDETGLAVVTEVMSECGVPLIADPSRAAGHHELLPALARIGVADGGDGLLVEVHPNPDQARSDGEQSLDFAGFDAMMTALQPWIELRAMASGEDGLEQGEFALKRTGDGAI